MTPEQVKMLREYHWKDDGTGQHMAGRLAIVFNNEVCFVDTRDFVIFDDDNELVHCIRANSEDPKSQAACPYRITTGMYDNAQYMEGLYSMRNFGSAVKELFVDTGLINAKQQEQIMNWANSIRNIPLDHHHHGPYFPNTTLPPACDCHPEINNSGSHREPPKNFITYQQKIDSFIKPAINASSLKPREHSKDYYDIIVDAIDTKGIATQMKNVIEAFPKNNIQKATISTNLTYIEYDPKNPGVFIEAATQLFDSTMSIYNKKSCLNWTITIDAFNTRKQYFFNLVTKREAPENPLKSSRK